MNIFLFPIYAVIAGFLVARFMQHRLGNLKLLLAFSGAFLLSITAFELIPEVFSEGDGRRSGLFVMLGVLLQICLEFFSKGAEHGHVHPSNSNLFPWLLFFSLSLHAFLEGFPIEQHNHLAYGILVHKVPIAIVLTTFLWNAAIPKYAAVLFLVLFALMTPLGTWVANNTDWVVDFQTEISAIVIGIFLHISTVILFESSEGHKFNLAKLLTIVLAITIAYLL